MADAKYEKVGEEDLELQNGEVAPEEAATSDHGGEEEKDESKEQVNGNGHSAAIAENGAENGTSDEKTDQAEITEEKQKEEPREEPEASTNYTKITNDTEIENPPSTFIVLSVLSTIFFPVFLGLNIFLSVLVILKTRKGNLKEAKRASKAALQLNIIGFIMGVLVYTAIIGYFKYIKS